MAFFRFNRDKRGYEHFYLVEPVTNRRGKTRPRVLYWYRTPPNVRVGRAPFDDDVQRALEAQNPNVTFDWRKIIDAPIPSADVEKWRERRRTERAEKAARQHAPPPDADEPSDLDADATLAPDDAPAQPSPAPETAAAPTVAAGERRKRRRRRRPRAEQSAATGPQQHVVESGGFDQPETGAADAVPSPGPDPTDTPGD